MSVCVCVAGYVHVHVYTHTCVWISKEVKEGSRSLEARVIGSYELPRCGYWDLPLEKQEVVSRRAISACPQQHRRCTLSL